MKHFMYAGALLCAMALMAGCSEEEQAGVAQSGNVTLTASTENGTRTTVGSNYNVLWSANDAIYLYGDNHTKGTFTLKEGEGTTHGTFEGKYVGNATDLKYAVYPAVTDGKITFPTTYTYPYNSNSPMWGTVSGTGSDLSVQFKHLCGMMRITINNLSKEACTITLTGKGIAGEATISEDASSGNGLSLGTITDTEDKTVTITLAADANRPGATVFDIPLPAAIYSNGIKLSGSVGGTEFINAVTMQQFEIKLGTITEMQALTYANVSGDTPSFLPPAESVEDAEEALKTQGGVSIPTVDASSEATTFTIPASSSPAATTTVSIGAISGTNTFTIVEAETATKPVNLLLGSGTESTDIATPMVINLDHVELATNGAPTTIDNMEVTTGKSTLVLKDGITINSLKINEGNVKMRGGSKINKLADGSNASSVIYYEIASQADADAYTEEGAVFTKVIVADGVSVDLTGKTITKLVQLEGSATITGGTINKHKETAGNADHWAVEVRKSGSVVTLNNVAINSTQGDAKHDVSDGVVIPGKVDNVKLTLKNCVIKAEGIGVWLNSINAEIAIEGGSITSNYFGVYQNGTYLAKSITIKDCTIEEKSNQAIYISNSGNRGKQQLNVTDSTIKGGTAIEVKHTDATITGCTLEATAEQDYKENNNGSCSLGYCFASTSNSNAEAVTGTCVLTDCKFTIASANEDAQPTFSANNGSNITITPAQ